VIGNKEYLFRSTYQLKAQFDNVAGLSKGRCAGGRSSQRNGAQHCAASQSANSHGPHGPQPVDARDHKRDSVASIETEGVLGNQFVAISFGTQDSRSEGWRDYR